MTTVNDGTPVKDAHKRRTVIIICAVVAAAALVVGGGLAWAARDRATALADCQESVRLARTRVAAYAKDRNDAAKAAKATPQGDVSDAKVINAAIVVKDVVPTTGLPACSTDASKRALDQTKAKADRIARDAAAADADIKTAAVKLAADEHKTVKGHLDKAVQDADQTLKDTDGKVADNATRDNLSKVLDEARKVQADKKATTVRYRQAIGDLGNGVKSVNDSKGAKDQADQAAAQQAQAQAQAQSEAGTAAANAGSGGGSYAGGGYSSTRGYTGGGYSGTRGYTGGGYGGGGYHAPSGGGAPSYTPPAGGNGGGNGGYTPTPHHEITQEDKDMAHHYECVMHPDITSGC